MLVLVGIVCSVGIRITARIPLIVNTRASSSKLWS